LESEGVKPGEKFVGCVETPIGNIAPFICYDLRFPYMATLARQKNCHIITYPSAFTKVTGQAHWGCLFIDFFFLLSFFLFFKNSGNLIYYYISNFRDSTSSSCN